MFYVAKVIIFLFQFLVIVLSVFGQTPEYIDIRVDYVTPRIRSLAANENTTWNASICSNAQERYNGTTAVVNFNLPLNLDWNPSLGVVLATVSNSTSLAPVLCRNDNGSALGNSCTFTYQTAMGPNIYIAIQAVHGTKDGVFYSTGITFIESGSHLPPVQHAKLTPRQENEIHEMATRPGSQKAVDTQSLVPVPRLHPGIVQTGAAVYYTLSIYLSSSRFIIEIFIVGVGPGDAFSSYVCKAKPCASDNSNVIMSDVSDSSLNALTISYDQIRPTGTVYVLIVGFGGKEENQFNLGAIIKNSI